MASTTNLGLTKIQGADYVSPDVFNDNYDKLDKMGVDYVVAEGEANGWQYRQWKSGVLETWISYTSTPSVTDEYHGNYECVVSPGNFPFAFSSKPTVTATVESSTHLLGCSACSVTATMCKFFLYSLGLSKEGDEVTLNVHAVGKLS